MTEPIFDPAAQGGNLQGENPPTQTTEPHQDIFGGSSDIFNNPDMFQAVTPAPKPAAEDDFHIDFDQLQINPEKNEEPIQEIIEPPVAPQMQAEYTPEPTPEIIEQVIEPQMKPEVKVNPRKQEGKRETANADQANPVSREPGTVQQAIQQPKPQVQKIATPEPRPVTPSKPVQQAKPQIQIQKSAPQVQAPKPAPQAPANREPRPATPTVPVQVVRPPEIQPEIREPRPVTPETDSVSAISDLQKKLNELTDITQNIYAIEKKDTEEILEILGANNDKVTILYQVTLPENGIIIKKIETDRATGEEMVNDLGFIMDTEHNSLQVILDDVLLLDEIEHLQDDPKKKMQVTEKLNKFIFLMSEYLKKAEKEAKEKEEAENERRRLQDIFRNF